MASVYPVCEMGITKCLVGLTGGRRIHDECCRTWHVWLLKWSLVTSPGCSPPLLGAQMPIALGFSLVPLLTSAQHFHLANVTPKLLLQLPLLTSQPRSLGKGQQLRWLLSPVSVLCIVNSVVYSKVDPDMPDALTNSIADGSCLGCLLDFSLGCTHGRGNDSAGGCMGVWSNTHLPSAFMGRQLAPVQKPRPED